MNIRTIETKDYSAVQKEIKNSFGSTMVGHNGEAELVESIRDDPSYRNDLELVAEYDNKLVGHILLTEATVISDDNTKTLGLNLAPFSVLPKYQNLGIGKKLIAAAEENAAKDGYGFVSVLGAPEYFNPLGYEAADKHNISSPLDIPSPSFMVKEIQQGGLKDVFGILYYLDEFGQS